MNLRYVDDAFVYFSLRTTSISEFHGSQTNEGSFIGIMDGKFCNLEKEIEGDASQELRLDAENIDEKSQQNFSEEKLFMNPTKIMDIVKKIGFKLENV